MKGKLKQITAIVALIAITLTLMAIRGKAVVKDANGKTIISDYEMAEIAEKNRQRFFDLTPTNIMGKYFTQTPNSPINDFSTAGCLGHPSIQDSSRTYRIDNIIDVDYDSNVTIYADGGKISTHKANKSGAIFAYYAYQAQNFPIKQFTKNRPKIALAWHLYTKLKGEFKGEVNPIYDSYTPASYEIDVEGEALNYINNINQELSDATQGDVRLETKDGKTYLGPYKINYSGLNINSITVEVNGSAQNAKWATKSNGSYTEYDVGGNVAIPSGSNFYIVLSGKVYPGNIGKIKISTPTSKRYRCRIILLSDGKSTKQYITIYAADSEEKSYSIELPKPVNVEGYYNIDLNKVDSANGSNLAGVKFKVKVDGTDIGEYTTDSNGKLSITGLKISEERTYTLELTETSTVKYYELLSNPIILKLTTGINQTTFAYEITNVTIEGGNSVSYQLDNNNISLMTQTVNLKVGNKRENIKLSGYVWEDEKAGKESSLNGIKDSNEKFISGLKVTVHTQDGSNIYYTNSSSQSTLTNNDGYYEFVVPAYDKGYYIEFTYNGQSYQHTKYVPWSITSSSNGKTSNATEAESTRDGMNSALEEITPDTSVKSDINQKGPTYIDNEKCTISAFTGGYGDTKDITYYNDNSEEINLGITKREEADLSLRKDVYKAKLSIKGYSHEYVYNKREGLETDAQGNSYWDIKARASDIYYGASYTRDVRAADYNYAGEKRLQATVTYKITIRNQSEGITAKVPEIVDYYDGEYTYESAYIGDKNGNKVGDIIASKQSKYGSSTTIQGYDKLYFTGIENVSLKPSADMYIFVTFKVNTDENGKVILDENDSGKGNITEIMGYKTYYEANTAPNEGNSNTYTEYKAGDIAGRVDVDSNPGNATSSDTNTFEDDTDRAPYIRFQLAAEERRTTGKIWVENRDNDQGGSQIGNGTREDDEPGVGGVTVELIDKETKQITKVWDGTDWKDGKVETSDDGTYTISGFIPGKYYLKFIYPDGQNYKSTIYNPEAVFDVNNPDEIGKYVETEERYSDARDIYNGKLTDNNETLEQLTSQYRQYVNDLLQEETNGKLREYEPKDKSVQAVTGMIEVNIEKKPDDTSSDSKTYRLDDIDFGIVERPKAQLMLTKDVSNVKVTLANGNTLFDATGKATNVLWQNKKYHEISYENNKLKQPVVSQNPQKIVLTMDEELMQGATISIKYAIKVSNVGEIDYTGYNFYYKGQIGSGSLVKTTIKGVIDYVGAALSDDAKATKNNLKFDPADSTNAAWETVNLEYLYKGEGQSLVSEELLKDNSGTYTGELTAYNTIIKNKMGETALTPQISSEGVHEVETPLTLSQVMSAQNALDDMSYNTMAEIIKVSNDVGRRMAFSTVGNQSPNTNVKEIDADCSTVTVLPPFGQKTIYYGLIAAVAVILIAGIVFIKIKVIDRK